MTTKTSAQLTLRDRLSRLTYTQAVKLLGPSGPALIREGGKHEIDIATQVRLDEDEFRVILAKATASIALRVEAPDKLCWGCTACPGACEHVGAAFSLILEEKLALGLAAPPPERVPIESLGEEALVRQAIEERRVRAREEKMRLETLDPRKLWTDYTITNPASGKTYRVALRGWEPGESYCSCPDFRKNTLGTCKHILHVIEKVRRRFPASVQKRPYRRRRFAVHVRYGKEVELRLLVPDDVDPALARSIAHLRDRPIEDVRELLRRVEALERKGQDVIVYPDAEELIQARLFQERIEALVRDIRKDPARHPLREGLLKVDLLPYQLDGIAFAAGAGRAILADDMGLGKTIQGIGVAEILAREAGIRKVLVVCPATLKSQWREEIRRFSDRDGQLILGPARERTAQYENGCFFTICNYEQVLRDILAIERVPWDLIVLDEGQRIKNWEAQTTRVVKGLRSRFALVLTGTPMENRLEELFSVVEFIDDRRLGPAFRFLNRHRVVDDKGRVLGYRDLDALRRSLAPVLLRRTREGVMDELPPRTTEIRRIAPTDEQFELSGHHLRLVSQIVHKPYLSEMDLLRLRKHLLMARMAADSTYLVDKEPPGYSSKLEELDGLIAALCEESGRKIVLFSEWTTMLGLIEERILRKRKLPYVRLDGSIPQKKRQMLVHAFQSDPDCRLFIATNAGSTGLNLQAANTVINVDLPWNPAVLDQRIGRAHRMGQKRPVQVYVLVTEATLEEKLLATLSAKKDLALAALDAESTVNAVDMASGIEQLRARLEVLLGAKPEAPLDVSERERQVREAERLQRRERVALAGGQLLTAAFAFLSEMVPRPAGVASAEGAGGGTATGGGAGGAGGGNGGGRSGAAGGAARDPEAERATAAIRERLEECVEKGPDGRPRLVVTLPDASGLDQLARSLAALLAGRGAGAAGHPMVMS